MVFIRDAYNLSFQDELVFPSYNVHHLNSNQHNGLHVCELSFHNQFSISLWKYHSDLECL